MVGRLSNRRRTTLLYCIHDTSYLAISQQLFAHLVYGNLPLNSVCFTAVTGDYGEPGVRPCVAHFVSDRGRHWARRDGSRATVRWTQRHLSYFEKVFFVYIATTELGAEMIFLLFVFGALCRRRVGLRDVLRLASRDLLHIIANPTDGSEVVRALYTFGAGIYLLKICLDAAFFVFCVPLWPPFGSDDWELRKYTCIGIWILFVPCAVYFHQFS